MDEKKKAIVAALDEGKAKKINALNGVIKPRKGRLGKTPKQVADEINPFTVRLLNRLPLPKYVGIMPIDFPSRDLVESIIRIAVCSETPANTQKKFCNR